MDPDKLQASQCYLRPAQRFQSRIYSLGFRDNLGLGFKDRLVLGFRDNLGVGFTV